MSYEPTTWVTGDIITATKLNNIESGVQSVSSSYTPTTWATGDIITATKLNNIEQGIANAGGGSSDFSTAQVTVKLAGERSVATFDVYLKDLLTSDANGLVAAEEDNIRYFTTDAQEIELDKPSHVEETKVIYLYKNNPVYVAYRLAESTAVYTITGSGEVVALNIDDSTIYAVKVTGDCTITIS